MHRLQVVVSTRSWQLTTSEGGELLPAPTPHSIKHCDPAFHLTPSRSPFGCIGVSQAQTTKASSPKKGTKQGQLAGLTPARILDLRAANYQSASCSALGAWETMTAGFKPARAPGSGPWLPASGARPHYRQSISIRWRIFVLLSEQPSELRPNNSSQDKPPTIGRSPHSTPNYPYDCATAATSANKIFDGTYYNSISANESPTLIRGLGSRAALLS
jgi:hypothetical protein